MLRYSLASLLAVLLYASIGCAALVNANGLWPQVAVTMAVVTLLVGTLAAICWQGASRAFALGFAVSGWLYFLLVFTVFSEGRHYLLTSTSVDFLYSTIHGDQTAAATPYLYPTQASPALLRVVPPPAIPPVPAPQPPQPVTTQVLAPTPAVAPASYAFYGTTRGPDYVDHTSFANIGHSLWAVIIGCLGGALAQLFSRRQAAAETSSPAEQAGAPANS